MDGLLEYFLARLDDRSLTVSRGAGPGKATAAGDTYAAWLRRQYSSYEAVLLDRLCAAGDSGAQTQALRVVMDLAGATAQPDLDHALLGSAVRKLVTAPGVGDDTLQKFITTYLGARWGRPRLCVRLVQKGGGGVGGPVPANTARLGGSCARQGRPPSPCERGPLTRKVWKKGSDHANP